MSTHSRPLPPQELQMPCNDNTYEHIDEKVLPCDVIVPVGVEDFSSWCGKITWAECHSNDSPVSSTYQLPGTPRSDLADTTPRYEVPLPHRNINSAELELSRNQKGNVVVAQRQGSPVERDALSFNKRISVVSTGVSEDVVSCGTGIMKRSRSPDGTGYSFQPIDTEVFAKDNTDILELKRPHTQERHNASSPVFEARTRHTWALFARGSDGAFTARYHQLYKKDTGIIATAFSPSPGGDYHHLLAVSIYHEPSRKNYVEIREIGGRVEAQFILIDMTDDQCMCTTLTWVHNNRYLLIGTDAGDVVLFDCTNLARNTVHRLTSTADEYKPFGVLSHTAAVQSIDTYRYGADSCDFVIAVGYADGSVATLDIGKPFLKANRFSPHHARISSPSEPGTPIASPNFGRRQNPVREDSDRTLLTRKFEYTGSETGVNTRVSWFGPSHLFVHQRKTGALTVVTAYRAFESSESLFGAR